MPTPLLHTPVFDVEGFPVDTRAGRREYVRLRVPDWVNVAAVTADGACVLVEQHRWGIDADTVEVPGGVVDPGESPLDAARRELREETGFGGGQWRSLGHVHPNPAIQDNRCWLFVATEVRTVGAPSLDPGEDIRVRLVPMDGLRDLLIRGTITHALAVVTLQRLLAERPHAW